MAVVTMKQLLEAGVHFGHQTRRWNPKMKRFIFGERNGIYIIDLQQTLERIETAYTFVRDLAADGGTVLFVGTKKQAQDPIERYAEKCGMPYINERWLGGMLTNFQTMQQAGRQDAGATSACATPASSRPCPRRKRCSSRRELDKLERNLGGIRNMEQPARRRVRARHEEGAHRGHRGQQARHPGRRRGRHQLRPRRHRLRDPRQRRRHPLRHPACAGSSPTPSRRAAHRLAQGAGRPAARSTTSSGVAAEQAEARRQAAARGAAARGPRRRRRAAGRPPTPAAGRRRRRPSRAAPRPSRRRPSRAPRRGRPPTPEAARRARADRRARGRPAAEAAPSAAAAEAGAAADAPDAAATAEPAPDDPGVLSHDG